jgi:iron(III) transport system permease protein
MERKIVRRSLPVSPTLTHRAWRVNRWSIFVVLLATVLTAPFVVIVGSWLTPEAEIWQHLATTVLSTYILNSCLLALGVGVGTFVIGTSTAWLVTMCKFPGRSVLEWGLLLPMAIPAYILAYTYTDFLQVSGPVQSFIRDVFSVRPREYWFPDVRSLPGAITMLTLALYPYVYLLARTAFLEGSTVLLEAAQSLRCHPWTSFFRVSLPLARPAIAGGVALALMEALSDFGTVDFFGVPTLTTGIYRTWFGMGERTAAAQLACCLLVFVVIVVWLERRSRRTLHHSARSERRGSLLCYDLSGWRAWLTTIFTFLPVLLGFLLPALLLIQLTLKSSTPFNNNFWHHAGNSFTLASVTAVLATVLAVLLAYGVRLHPNRLNRSGSRLATLGYAVPGSVIAVSTLIAFGWLDTQLNTLSNATLGQGVGLVFSGTMLGLLYAYIVRFLVTSFSGIEARLKSITPSMDNAAKSLGYRSLATLRHVHVPLLHSSLLTALLLVFVEVIKELPATLIIRPFNLDTLAVQVYRLAADERLREAAPGALAIVLVSLIPVIVLSIGIGRSRQQKN